MKLPKQCDALHISGVRHNKTGKSAQKHLNGWIVVKCSCNIHVPLRINPLTTHVVTTLRQMFICLILLASVFKDN